MIHLFRMRLIVTVSLLLHLKLCLANPLLSGFAAEYEVSKNGTVLGISHRQLISRDQGKKLDYAATTLPTGIISLFVSDRFMEHSQMHHTAAGIRPLQYEYQRTGGKKEITFKASFNWHKKQLLLSNQTRPQTLLPNSHDLLSFQLALMQGLAQGSRQFSFQIVDHKRVQSQRLEYVKSKKMTSALGELEVLQLNQSATNSHYHFSFWCAKELFYLPVIITKTEHDGDIIELRLTKFNKTAIKLLDSHNEINGEF